MTRGEVLALQLRETTGSHRSHPCASFLLKDRALMRCCPETCEEAEKRENELSLNMKLRCQRTELIKIPTKVRRRNSVIFYTSTLEACIINKRSLNCLFGSIFWPNWYYWSLLGRSDWLNIKINGYNLFRNNQMWGRKEKGGALYQGIHCLFGDICTRETYAVKY